MSGDAETLTELRTVVRQVVKDFPVTEHIRSRAPELAAFDGHLWSTMAELGWLALDVDEGDGGVGAGFDHVAVVLEELGQGLADSGAYFATAVLGAGAIKRLGDREQRRRWLPELAEGRLRSTAVLPDAQGGADLLHPPISCVPADMGWELTGMADYVLAACEAQLIITPAVAPDGTIRVFVVDAGDDGVSVRPRATVDLSRDFGTVTFTSVACGEDTVLAVGEPATSGLGWLLDRASVGLAADAVGMLERSLAVTVAYARTREQFGRAIGSFQAVKHQCADMLVSAHSARSILSAAVRELDEDSVRSSLLCSTAKFRCAREAAAAAGTGIQLHGAIGYSWEHEMHLIFKRAQLGTALYGTTRWHRRRVADALLDPECAEFTEATGNACAS